MPPRAHGQAGSRECLKPFTSGNIDRKSVAQGKRADVGVTGLQTCALPICSGKSQPGSMRALYAAAGAWPGRLAGVLEAVYLWKYRSEERRAGKESRCRCDWTSDVCSSDL